MYPMTRHICKSYRWLQTTRLRQSCWSFYWRKTHSYQEVFVRIRATGYRPALIKQAEKGDVATRKEQEPEGKGNHLVVNTLTEKGRKVAGLIKDTSDNIAPKPALQTHIYF